MSLRRAASWEISRPGSAATGGVLRLRRYHGRRCGTTDAAACRASLRAETNRVSWCVRIDSKQKRELLIAIHLRLADGVGCADLAAAVMACVVMFAAVEAGSGSCRR
jgi:hypothetical protein